MKFIITDLELTHSQRLDSVLSQKLQMSKNQISHAIKRHCVTHNGKICTKNGVGLKAGDEVCIMLKTQESLKEKPAFEGEIEVLYEDDDVLVLNKPPHLVVHQAPSVKDPTLVDYLKSKNYALSSLSGEERYGIIHRLDKPTSGAIVVAKNNTSHAILSEQLQKRQMGRYYLAIIDLPLREEIEVECFMGRNPKNRLKMAKLKEGRYSKSCFFPLFHQPLGLVLAKLHTGRTHQIRLHLETLCRHIIGDELYGKKDDFGMRLMLHAYLVYFIHPRTQKKHLISAPLFEDMLTFAQEKFGLEAMNEVLDQEYLLRCCRDCL